MKTTKELGLTAGENIILQTKINNSQFLPEIILGLLSIICFMISFYFGLIVMLATFGILIQDLIKVKNTVCIVTNKKVFYKSGLFSSKVWEQFLAKIEGVHVEQNFSDKIFKSGKVIISGTGGTKTEFKNIDNPYEFRQVVNELIHK